MLIKQVFKEFLEEQKERLSEKTYKDYEEIIELFEDCLDGYAWNYIDDSSKAYEDAHKKDLTFIDIYEHTYIFENVGEFLDYFIPRKVNWGKEFVLKRCPRVIRKLLKWMQDRGMLDKTNEDIKWACENQMWEDSLKDMGFS
ncbi:MAG: hypothetical protein U9R75_00900 [Candidatus Thermoplasmatota archaeon]|nr:hypothetical protein [Candidatus Thermoplasmatota archaeon]